jgi:hypothetical protein
MPFFLFVDDLAWLLLSHVLAPDVVAIFNYFNG